MTPESFALAQAQIKAGDGVSRTRNEKDLTSVADDLLCDVRSSDAARSEQCREGRGREDRQDDPGVPLRVQAWHGSNMTPCGGARINANWVEGFVWQNVHQYLSDPSFRRRELAKIAADDSSRPLRDALDSARSILAKETKVEQRLYQAWLGEDDADFAARLQTDHAAARVRVKGQERDRSDRVPHRCRRFRVAVRAFDEHCERIVGSCRWTPPPTRSAWHVRR